MTVKGSLQRSIAIVKAFKPIFGPKFGWVTWPVNRGSPVTLYLNSPTPICLFNIQLSWDYDNDKGSLQVSIAIV